MTSGVSSKETTIILNATSTISLWQGTWLLVLAVIGMANVVRVETGLWALVYVVIS